MYLLLHISSTKPIPQFSIICLYTNSFFKPCQAIITEEYLVVFASPSPYTEIITNFHPKLENASYLGTSIVLKVTNCWIWILIKFFSLATLLFMNLFFHIYFPTTLLPLLFLPNFVLPTLLLSSLFLLLYHLPFHLHHLQTSQILPPFLYFFSSSFTFLPSLTPPLTQHLLHRST